MDKTKINSPILLKYLESFEKNPNSKVFAPLAEGYRKLGMIDEAYKVLKKGIKHHPSYVLGYTTLANCYFDQGKYDLAYNTMRPLVSTNLDNVALQRLFAQTCQKLDYLEEALETYKYLLFINPKDKVIGAEVLKIEEKLQICITDTVGPQPFESYFEAERALNFKTDNLSPALRPTSEDDWVKVDFAPKSSAAEFEEVENDEVEFAWKMQQRPSQPQPQKDSDQRTVKESDQDLLHVKDRPIISLELVDLYCAGGHWEQARELLLHFLELSPENEAVKQRLAEIQEKHNHLKLQDKSPDEGHDRLMHSFDQTISTKKQQLERLKEKLQTFLQAIHERHRQLPFYIEAKT